MWREATGNQTEKQNLFLSDVTEKFKSTCQSQTCILHVSLACVPNARSSFLIILLSVQLAHLDLELLTVQE